jgi:hypothetical protein
MISLVDVAALLAALAAALAGLILVRGKAKLAEARVPARTRSGQR